MRVLLVTNANSGSAGGIDPSAVLVDEGCEVTTVDIADAAAGRVPEPTGAGAFERVVVAGGDGSIGPAARIACDLDVPIGVVPAGTANDFARALGLPEDLEVACRLAASGQHLQNVDLADVDGMPFVNVASIGLAPHAAQHAGKLKAGLKSLAYPVGAAIAAVRSRPISIVASVDGEPFWSGRAWQVMLASTGAFGGWASTGRTRDGDGQLDLVIVPAQRATRRLAFDAAALVRGELAQRDGVHHARGSRLEVVLHRAPRIVVDGELVEVDDRRVVATVADRAVRVVVMTDS